MTTIVKCPTCNKDVEWTKQQKWRPFCSDRCRLIDLGEWANESHRIAGSETIPEELLDTEQYKDT
ncbi:MAG: DNA gyrase inhibitor YacG [Gammaproteobacteria bacterium]|nr:DNA gyrase inhibitor YacG [Gammaproteobacteria bacterium]MDH5777928.1 DNA gyrase inhibitor YacG [Gammaproteobacteria bacterium]